MSSSSFAIRHFWGPHDSATTATVIIRVRRHTLHEIDRHAAESYPRECCGIVVGDRGHERVRRIDNIQHCLHAEDPAAHPRDSRTAYFMDPRQLYAALRDAERESSPI